VQNKSSKKVNQRGNNQLLIEILDCISDGIFSLNREWACIFINKTAASNLGFTPAELIGQNLWGKFPKILGTAHEVYYRKAMIERKTQHFEISGVLTDKFYAITVFPSFSGIIVHWQDITEGKKAEMKEKEYATDLLRLSKAATALVELPAEENIYQLIIQQLQQLVKDMRFAIVSSFDESSNLFQVQAVSGNQSEISALTGMLGQDLMSLPIPISDQARIGLTSGSLQKVPNGLYDLASGLIPTLAAKQIEEHFGVGEVYSMGFYWQGKLYGSLSILLVKGYELLNPSVIETFVHQAAIALQRKQAMADLAKAKDKLEAKVKERTRKLTQANELLKQYGHRITQVQEAERKRIAYELHDDTAQYISILKMQINALINSGEIQNPRILEKLQFLERDSDRAFQDVRRYSHELRPTALEHMGLQAALEQISEDYNKIGQLSIEVNVGGSEPKLSEEVKLGFFRIAQEALNNIRKHAKASKAIIYLSFQEYRLEMSVSDNGTGFDVKEARNRSSDQGSLGLLSMRERADLIGARLKIESQPGQGTTVRVDLTS
jgi:signal transduction histidine kinase